MLNSYNSAAGVLAIFSKLTRLQPRRPVSYTYNMLYPCSPTTNVTTTLTTTATQAPRQLYI
jgi:hypothetical protein